MISRKLCLINKFKNFQQTSRCLSGSLKENKNPRKLIQNGPGLKEFIINQKTEDSNQDEIASNEIFLKNLENQQIDSDINLASPRKVYFEVHGCQMNTNDTEVAYSILNKTGLYTRTSQEKDADVVLIMTCSIRENAEQKIWNRLREYCHQKK